MFLQGNMGKTQMYFLYFPEPFSFCFVDNYLVRLVYSCREMIRRTGA